MYERIIMAILNIVKEPDSILQKKSRPVEKFDERLHTLLDDMHETLEKAQGAGLAGVQVGILRRVALVDGDDGNGVYEIINPEIIEVSGEREVYEGCLSYPGKWVVKKRPEKVSVRALDRFGNEVLYRDVTGLRAQAFCHEIEHMDAIVLEDNIVRYASEDEFE